MPDSNVNKSVIPITAVPAHGGKDDDEVMVSLYAARQKIYPRSVSGLFSNWRWITVWITQIVFYGLPWLEWNARQAVLFDLEARRFYIFNLVLYPQDFIYLTGLLVISALALFLFTAVAGRLWCGYACPQTVYTEIFLWIEKKVEGDRSARMRLDQAAFSAQKLGKKWLKHGLWIAFSLWTGFTFVGYFTPIRELTALSLAASLGPWQTFWVFFYGFATYGNAGFMREQVCKYMCPYARFQSAMFDKDTMIVTYDEKRGEPRGPRSKKADPLALGLGSCIDCTLCVQVCPTGIDIRKGLQYECIGCGACIDVCDEVMDKVGYPRGLVKYSTQNGIAQGWNTAQMIKRAFRPRVLVYTGILVAITLAVMVSLFLRKPLKVDVLRDRGVLARMVEQGRIENVFRLQIMNATESTQRYVITVTGLPGVTIASDNEVEVLATEVRSAAIRVQIPPDAATPGSHPIQFAIRSVGDESVEVSEKAAFLVPR
ncbi:MAG: cytochrome c oxidase accessory protein CcoG [Hydrogenophaga sp.]|uniref:cytochrome c oxidase accessory protein CcoG n=1 Tax=Hydrogenophaga sp. TaxID=1904254 RepID=UPI0027278AAC|nr:cytochrome c oxidase accessory protein CcoG [Hydrogenophaga sp.]MDO9149220.1 cytochrome c oxidase accessory protein CcoG [Hydrogenophaga sp.]MDO9605803.1 cytochrome c oxidase accessory protein CcoG [Hydrogenophaga sp.]MDP2166535.1 cytochrome c oxidase accessory protein CcoG [Hydrogenophaga sp.]MDP3476058.1 cytochrome c oxidase accessory protein CcoG [Hydrogenophaga sp.]